MQGIIIGAGIAGLATAVAMRRRGLRARVYERGAATTTGAGLILPVNAMRVLDRLGLAEQVYRRGNEVTGMYITDAALQPLTTNVLPYFLNKYGFAQVAIRRSALRDLLLEQLGGEAPEWGRTCVHLAEKDRRVEARFSEGEPAYGDYAVAADGLGSALREQCFPEAALRDAGQICWRGVVDFELPARYLHHAVEAWGPGRRFGFVALEGSSVYWYAVINKHIEGFDARADVRDALGHLFLGFAPLLRQLIAGTLPEHILRHELADLKPMRQWFAGRISLLGDAAHAATPNLGQGAGQAIEDAWVMAALMDRYKNPVYAFPVFQQLRKARADYVTKLSRRIGRLSQYENRWLVGLRAQLLKTLPDALGKATFGKLFAVQLD